MRGLLSVSGFIELLREKHLFLWLPWIPLASRLSKILFIIRFSLRCFEHNLDGEFGVDVGGLWGSRGWCVGF